MADSGPGLVHFTFDTFPRVTPARGGLVVRAPFRVETRGWTVLSGRLVITVDGIDRTARGWTRRIRKEFVDGLRARQERAGMFDFTALPPYLEMDARMAAGGVAYLEGQLSQVPEGARVAYTMEALVQAPSGEVTTVHSPRYSLRAVAPAFGESDILRTHIDHPGDALDAWVLYHRRDETFDHVRIDVVSLQPDPNDGGADHERVALTVGIGDGSFALRSPDLTELPLVDTAADSVTFSVEHGGSALPPVTLSWNGNVAQQVDLAAAVESGRARVMFVNFAIQGLNDYFATPDTVYDPPRTYMQVTMRDELATFSSRPGSRENGVGDGYAFTMNAHRAYRLPQMWAMNGGMLALMAHDCPDDLARMREDAEAGLLVPVHTGYGAHRVPYYSMHTNASSIRLGAAAWTAMVAPPAPVYYPDSRIFVNEPQVTGALAATGMTYLCVDAGEHEDGTQDTYTVVRNPKPAMGAVDPDGRWLNWQYLWQDSTTGLRLLFIDREMKDNLLGGAESDADRGKIAFNLRRKFIELATQPQLRRDNLLVYSDDADKASGNGWFDGDYGASPPMNKHYQAALSWIAAHPWVRVVTTKELDDEPPVGTLDLVRASDPYIEKEWRLSVPADPRHSHGLAFDTWYAAWARVRAEWLGERLGAISDRAQLATATCAGANGLAELARLTFVMNLHESQWSKRSRNTNPDPNRPTEEPEDFVVAESIQLRSTHVYLHAALWADWATRQRRRGTRAAFRDTGPVIDAVAAAEARLDTFEPGGVAPAWAGERRGLQWDHDPLPNVVLYNEEALVLIDANGGCITHAFAFLDDRPVSLSGTPKAYQFIDIDWNSTTGTECDGMVLQNTVHTPNHAYVASDTLTRAGVLGESPAEDAVFDWYYPDNFNAYDVDPDAGGPLPSVTLRYGPATMSPDDAPATLADLDRTLAEDREAKLAGERGHVLHDTDTFGEFEKTIRLDGRTLHVTYRGTRPGHVVANEFCVDLHAAALRGQRQSAVVDPDGTAATVTSEDGPSVRVVIENGCRFSDACVAGREQVTVEALRLHRVMTDNLELVATDAEGFGYRIELLPDQAW